jgi:hypothetical protein
MAGSREFYRPLPGGGKEDAHLHDGILDNPEADRATLIATRQRLIASGEDPALIEALYPLDGDE